MRALAFLVASCLAAPANAAKIEVWADYNGQGISIDGDIVQGDFVKFGKQFDRVYEKSSATVILRSEGGDAGNGILIGDLVRRSGMNTMVPEGGTCASACAMVWIAGVQKRGGFGVNNPTELHR